MPIVKAPRSYTLKREWGVLYTGGPIKSLPGSEKKTIIAPCNGGLNMIETETVRSMPIIENDEDNPDDFDVITGYNISKNGDFLACGTRSKLLKLFKRSLN